MNGSMLVRLDMGAELAERNKDVASQFALGFPAKIVAVLFGISPRTAEKHKQIAMRKTGAKNASELAVWFLCKEFHATMIISEGKRRIITACFLVLFLLSEFCGSLPRVRTSVRVRTRTEIRGKEQRKEYIPNGLNLES